MAIRHFQAQELTAERWMSPISAAIVNASTQPTPLPVPAQYRRAAQSSFDASQADMLHLYAAYARAKTEGRSDAPSFRDAVQQHELIDQIVHTSERFFD